MSDEPEELKRCDLRSWWMLADAAETGARFEPSNGSWTLWVSDRPDAAPCGITYDKRTAGWWRAANEWVPEMFEALERALMQRDWVLNELREASPDRWLRMTVKLGATGAAGDSDWHSSLALEVERFLIEQSL